MKNKEIKKLSNDELENKLNKLKKDLFNIRFKKANAPLEDTSKFPQIKKDLAKILTKINNNAAGRKINKMPNKAKTITINKNII